jgi:hypothetical protein
MLPPLPPPPPRTPRSPVVAEAAGRDSAAAAAAVAAGYAPPELSAPGCAAALSGSARRGRPPAALAPMLLDHASLYCSGGGGRPGFGRRHCAAGALGAGLRGYPQ